MIYESCRPIATPSLAIHETLERFPVGRIFCVGRNYAAHVAEMGGSTREPPFFFTKFPAALVPDGTRLRYPDGTADFQFEGELVVAIGAEGAHVRAAEAHQLIFGYAAGLDMTRRDLQLAARDRGRPWDVGKNFEQSAPVGLLHRFSRTGPLERGTLELCVNDKRKQHADLGDMIWKTGEIIEHLSKLYRLAPGDLIFTGTPAGVGPVVSGDRIDVRIEGLSPLSVTVE
jgi:fumarylpyruvate hydrolase